MTMRLRPFTPRCARPGALPTSPLSLARLGGPEWRQAEGVGSGELGDFFGFVNGDLIPHLKSLAQNPNATARQKIIGEALLGVEKTRVDTEKNLLDVLDRIDALNVHAADGTHMFPLTQVYEGCCSRWATRATTAASSSPRTK